MTLSDLMKLAEAATSGPWQAYRQDEDSGAIYFAIHSHQQYEFITNVNDGRARANAKFIAAAHPGVVTALVKVAMAAEALRPVIPPGFVDLDYALSELNEVMK